MPHSQVGGLPPLRSMKKRRPSLNAPISTRVASDVIESIGRWRAISAEAN